MLYYLCYNDGFKPQCRVVSSDELNRILFSPLTIEIELLSFCVIGNTYKERKNDLKEWVLRFQNCNTEYSGGNMTQSEYMLICNFLERNAKRYGLMKEFKENGVI